MPEARWSTGKPNPNAPVDSKHPSLNADHIVVTVTDDVVTTEVEHLETLRKHGWAFVNLDVYREILNSLAVADHVGDVNNDIPRLCGLIGVQPIWLDAKNRWGFPWNEEDNDGG